MTVTGDFKECCFNGEVGSDWKQAHGSDGKRQNLKMSQVGLLAWDSSTGGCALLLDWNLHGGEAATYQSREAPSSDLSPLQLPTSGLNE